MNKIICITDSMGMPREEYSYENTWISILKRKLNDFDFICFTRRQETTKMLNSLGGDSTSSIFPKGSDLLEFIEPTYAIIQLGIVDCSPRLLNRYERFILARIKSESLKSNIISLLKKIKKRDSQNVFVNPLEFESNIDKYIQRAITKKVKRVFFFKILANFSILENKQYKENILKYNNILTKLEKKYPKYFKVVEFEVEDKMLLKDGYHLSLVGQKKVASEILHNITLIEEN